MSTSKEYAKSSFGLPEAIPYDGSKKKLYLIEDLDNPKLAEIIKTTLEGPKKK